MPFSRLALLLAVAITAFPAGAQNTAVEDRRSVSVSGQGEVSVRPDRARLALAVERLQPDARQAQAEVEEVVRAYVAAARALGAREHEIATAAVSLMPEYVWDEPTRQNRLRGYRARRDVLVTVVKLDQLGDFIQKATQLGVTHISPPVLEASNAKALMREALVRATEDAREKALLLAQTLKLQLGTIRALNATEFLQPPPLPMMKTMSARAEATFDGGAAPLTVEPGELKMTATVSAEFDLLAP